MLATRGDFGPRSSAGTISAVLLAMSSIGVSSIGATSPAQAGTGATRIIELFTSQGCPKCPPADRLITDLAQDPGTIALSFAVSTWDYIGWKDTLASPAFTARQYAYAAARGDRRVFTPQAIVDGIGVQPGADKSAILHDSATLAGRNGAMRAPLNVSSDGHMLHIAIGPASADMARDEVGTKRGVAGVYVLRVARAKTVQIDRGENSGRSVTYTNAVRAMKRIGDWTGKPVTFDLVDLKDEGEDYVVLVQAGTPDRLGPILAAAKTTDF